MGRNSIRSIAPWGIFFVKLKPLTYFWSIETQFGSVRIPEYAQYANAENLKYNVICLLGYFCREKLPVPIAFIYLPKQRFYVSKHGWLSLYATKFGIRRVASLRYTWLPFIWIRCWNVP